MTRPARCRPARPGPTETGRLAGLDEQPDHWTDQRWREHLIATADRVPPLEVPQFDRRGRGITRVKLGAAGRMAL
jgi:hypothetical protein